MREGGRVGQRMGGGVGGVKGVFSGLRAAPPAGPEGVNTLAGNFPIGEKVLHELDRYDPKTGLVGTLGAQVYET